MQRKWRTILIATGAALLGASVLTVAADGVFEATQDAVNRNVRAADSEPCPPDACSIVFKAESDGAPSRILPPG